MADPIDQKAEEILAQTSTEEMNYEGPPQLAPKDYIPIAKGPLGGDRNPVKTQPVKENKPAGYRSPAIDLSFERPGGMGGGNLTGRENIPGMAGRGEPSANERRPK